MEIKQLSTFRLVARHLSFSKAAEELSYAQSTVTAQIQALERELGVPLFDRLGKRIALTEAGKRLLSYAEKLTNIEEEARQAITHADEMPFGELTIAVGATLMTYYLPPVFRAYRDRYPDVKLILHPGHIDDFLDLVVAGEADLAVVYRTEVNAEVLDYEEIHRDRLLLVAAPDFPLAQRHNLMNLDLADENLLLSPVTCPYRHVLEQALIAHDIPLNPSMELATSDAIKQCALAGLGVGFLPEIMVRQEIAEGTLIDLGWPDEAITITALVAWNRDRWVSPAAHAFRRLLHEMMNTPVKLAGETAFPT